MKKFLDEMEAGLMIVNMHIGRLAYLPTSSTALKTLE